MARTNVAILKTNQAPRRRTKLGRPSGRQQVDWTNTPSDHSPLFFRVTGLT